MQARRAIVLLQGIAACALWIGGLPVLRSATAPASPQEQSDTGVKPKKPRKSDAATMPAPATNAVENKAKVPAPVKNASDTEIQAAKSSGKVWVNTDSGVYHKGGKWFGATKQGKFMTEQEAVKAGYRPAKNEK